MPIRPERIESIKLWMDYFKHLTTLSTGAILIISTFLEKLFVHPQWKTAVVIALAGFLLCVLGSVVALSFFAAGMSVWTMNESATDWSSGVHGNIALIGMLVAWSGFLVGLVSLTSFTIKNLL